jgi:hypothetical protein
MEIRAGIAAFDFESGQPYRLAEVIWLLEMPVAVVGVIRAAMGVCLARKRPMIATVRLGG